MPHLAVCSGNHDPDGAEGAGWLGRVAAGLEAERLLVNGTSAALLDAEGGSSLVVTCYLYWNIQERGLAHHTRLRKRAAAGCAERRRLADAHPVLSWSSSTTSRAE